MTRALHAALHGRWGEAFRFNPLGMVMLPAWLVYMGFQMPAWLRPGPRPLRIRIAPCGVWWILGLVLGYWVLRNLPVWPYVLPAPP